MKPPLTLIHQCQGFNSSLGLGMEDRLHQPYRKALIPGLEDVFAAAKKAGAHGVALSGSGSSVVALTHRYPHPIGRTMREAFKCHGIEAKIMVLDADNEGVKVQANSHSDLRSLLFRKSRAHRRYDYEQTGNMDEDYFKPIAYYNNINTSTVWMCGY